MLDHCVSIKVGPEPLEKRRGSGGPEPLEKESHEFLGSKRDYRFSNPFFEMVPKHVKVRFSYLL